MPDSVPKIYDTDLIDDTNMNIIVGNSWLCMTPIYGIVCLSSLYTDCIINHNLSLTNNLV